MATKVCALSFCHKPVWIEPRTGIEHDYCGRTHAKQALGEKLQAPHGCCHICNLSGCQEPVLYEEETGRVHDFCSKTHADEAISQGRWQPSLKRDQSRGGRRHPDDECGLPGCTAPRYEDPRTGQKHDYCGKSHAIKAKERGFEPLDSALMPGGVERVYGGPRCGSRGGAQVGACVPGDDYTISLMTNNHPKYHSIKKQFLDAWRHRDAKHPLPTVCRILQIKNAPSVFRAYENYADSKSGGAVAQMSGGVSVDFGAGSGTGYDGAGYGGAGYGDAGYGGAGYGGAGYGGAGYGGAGYGGAGYGGAGYGGAGYGGARSMFGFSAGTGAGTCGGTCSSSGRCICHHGGEKRRRGSTGSSVSIASTSSLSSLSSSLSSSSSSSSSSRSGGGSGSGAGVSRKTEVRRFHGTSMHPSCNFGAYLGTKPCSEPTCAVCSICCEGFSMRHASTNSFQRFGRGIYFSSTSSKSHDYSGGSERADEAQQRQHGKVLRMMFLCKVVAGRTYNTFTSMTQEEVDKRLEQGFDSVRGDVGQELNHDELVVYNDAAAIPSYLIVYRLAPL